MFFPLSLICLDNRQRRDPGLFKGDKTRKDCTGGLVYQRGNKVRPICSFSAFKTWSARVTKRDPVCLCAAEWQKKWETSSWVWGAVWSILFDTETTGCLLEDLGPKSKASLRRWANPFDAVLLLPFVSTILKRTKKGNRMIKTSDSFPSHLPASR